MFGALTCWCDRGFRKVLVPQKSLHTVSNTACMHVFESPADLERFHQMAVADSLRAKVFHKHLDSYCWFTLEKVREISPP